MARRNAVVHRQSRNCDNAYRCTLRHPRQPARARSGNGGAGPFYGIHPLGALDGAEGQRAWDRCVGSLAEPFAFREAWNDLTGRPDDALVDRDEREYERLMDAFERRYWHASVMNGAFPICHQGCALRIWLVVSGDEAGTVWRDDRARLPWCRPDTGA